ncbi:15173_t:CDS:2 [Entrophospora sp. SA101]|nr:15173_t:CDS:2 [Entrophospora sp. SA101]
MDIVTGGFSKKCLYAELKGFKSGLENGVGRTPAMGWNSWNKFGCNINETLIRDITDALIETGLSDVGYQYVNLDDCWQKTRTWSGIITPDSEKFPSGLESLSDYIHSKGLLFGLYSSAGFWTCAKRPGSLLHEDIDAELYAKWKVDYLKYDNWMHDALNITGRPILYSICSWGKEDPWIWGSDIGNSWRTTSDISDYFTTNQTNDPQNCNPCGVLEILDSTVGLEKYSSPGGFNDLDMLEVGNGGMTFEEYKSHFSLWAALKSPLLIGCDVRNMTDETIQILNNTEIIGINQDPLGKSAKLAYREKHKDQEKVSTISYDIWIGELSILLNRNDEDYSIKFPFELLGPFFSSSFNSDTTSLLLRDLWQHKDLGSFTKEYISDKIPAHGVVVLKITYSHPKFNFIAQLS